MILSRPTIRMQASLQQYIASVDKALAEIERGRGAAYDANVVDACVRLFREKGYAIPT